jgi:radical SAM protein with 4Fe4S-binding SPASM domain
MTVPVQRDIEKQYRQINVNLNALEATRLQPTLTSFPPLVQVSTGCKCNLRCAFCTERSSRTNSVYDNLSLEEFIPLTDALPYASTVHLNGWGEPLFNPEYKRIFKHITEHYSGIRIHLSTNGTLLGPAWRKRFVKYGNLSMNVSINAATRETYHQVVGKDLFEKLIDNLTSFRDMREAAGIIDTTNFSCSFVVMKQNLEEMPRFVDLAATLRANRVQFMDLMLLTKESLAYAVTDRKEETVRSLDEAVARGRRHGIVVGSFLNSAANDCLVVNKTREQDDPNPTQASRADDAPVRQVRLRPCYAPWTSIMTTMDGGVHPCCRSNRVLGNLRERSIAEVWNGSLYQDFRKRVNSAEPPKECRLCPVKYGL